jgi:mannose/fructose-specific phosphotransferase system component IIA
MLDSAAMICGPLGDAVALDLQPEQTPEAFGDAIHAAIRGAGRPVLILTDLIGGTPHNVAQLACRQARASSLEVACVSGANLGLLLEAAISVECLDPTTIERLVAAGRAGIAACAEVCE